MKLFSEKLTKYKFLLLSIFIIVEFSSFILLFISYKSIYLNVFDQTKEVAIEKAKSINLSLNQLYKLTLYKDIQDLKFIGKHMSFLANNEINNKSKYYQNVINNNNSHIYYATVGELTYFNEYYNDEIKQFLYYDNYVKNYIDNISNRKNILSDMSNKDKHPELNSISYYKYNGSINDIENNQIKKAAAKYLISILKTNYLTRFLVKGKDFDLMHYFLLTKDELYIYPPEAYNNSFLYIFSSLINCQNFPECVYDFIINKTKNNIKNVDNEDYIFPAIPISYLDYQIIVNLVCLNIPFTQKLNLTDFTKNPIMCIEINTTKIFNKNFEQVKENFHFIFFTPESNNIIALYNDKTDLYEPIKKLFNNSKFGNYSLNHEKKINYFYFFHFLYFDLFQNPSLLKENNINYEDIIKEYEVIKDKILEVIKNPNNSIDGNYNLEVEKTTCKSDLYYNGQICLKDSFLMVISPIYGDFNYINENYIDVPNKTIDQILFYSLSIIANNYKYNKWKINQIIVIKIVKLFFFYFVSSMCLIFLFFVLVQIFFEFKYETINQILNIIKGGSFFEIKDKNEIIKIKEESPIEPNNKEMLEIKNLFDYLIKTMLLKINFEQNENSYNKKKINTTKIDKNKKNQTPSSNNNINNNKNLLGNKNNIDTLNEYMELINNINNKEIRIMFAFIISYNHFRKGFYKLSENEFKNLIKEVNIYQNKISNKNENNDSKLKDSISRCSKISYLNEYSLTNELSETTLPIIKLKLMAQKIYYLYAMTIFNQEKKKSNSDKKYNKENAKKRYEESIKYFIECKNISILLGTDTIRQIFSLIMISKCYIELKNYKESMININEALLLYSDLQKAFKDKPYFNPKIMMFTENYIFQNIMLTIAQITYSFNKYPQSCWILMKMIETSPFVFNSIHFQACFLLCSCLNQIENLNNLPFRQIDKYKKKIYKMFTRINVRLLNKEKIGNKDSKNNSTNNNYSSLPSMSNNQINNLSVSIDNFGNASNLKKLNRNKDMFTNKFSISINSLTHLAKTQYKNITLCISEKLLQEINGDELKDVIIKFFKKCFSNSVEEDKFCFIQFSCNGKKTISIKSDSIEIFLQKLEVNKMAFKINEAFTKNNNQIQFMEFSNLFMNIIKSHKQSNYEDQNDNIIIIFINTSDIRFNGEKECVDTINELNNNNYSVIIFTYDTEINEQKIEGIYSFVYGLNDGHFFQIKNYQQIKQVFMNFCVKDSQEKFSNYNYEITDCML